MTVLPIVARELRVAARRPGTYWARLSAAGGGLMVGGWMWLVLDIQPARNLGIALFTGIAVAAYIYAGIAGALVTADSLTEEKREGTLGLLFLTDLKGYDLVLGKLTASSLSVAYGLVALFPVLAIPLLMGGVSAAEFARVVVVCLNTLLFSLAVGMLSSSLCQNERRALGMALVILAVTSAVLPVFAGLLYERFRSLPLMFFLLVPSPSYAGALAFDEVTRGLRQNYFWLSVLLVHGASWLMLLTATLVLPRTWQDKPSGPGRGRGLWHWLVQRSPAARLDLRRRLMLENPIYWLTARDRGKAMVLWLGLVAGGLLWTLGWWLNPRDWVEIGICGVTVYVTHSVLKIWLTVEACRQFSGDRRSGALELLLVTPISPQMIVHGQLRALLSLFGGPLVVVLVVDLVFWNNNPRDVDWALYMGAIVIMLLADLAALACVGMWQGLRKTGTMRAVIATAIPLLVLPWALYAMVTSAVIATNIMQSSSVWMQRLLLLSGPALAVVLDLVFGGLAWRRLNTQFRLAAADPPKRAGRLGRFFGLS